MARELDDRYYDACERAEERREAKRDNPLACRCGNPDMPGRCPGWRWCPMQQEDDEEES